MQERLTEQIAEGLCRVLNPSGVGVVIEAYHLCMMMRGVQKQNSKTITSALQGSVPGRSQDARRVPASGAQRPRLEVSDLRGKTAVVTGASRGIGAGDRRGARRRRARRSCWSPAPRPRSRSARNALKESIAIPCDVTDPKSVERAAETISSGLGGAPDILVNNAGIFSVAVAEETTAEASSTRQHQSGRAVPVRAGVPGRR